MSVKWQGLRHPQDMGQQEIEGFPAIMADNRFGAFGWTAAQGRSGTARFDHYWSLDLDTSIR